jgi:uncharacterized protein YfaS (alpha-2-macroglobulin family)
MRRFTFLSLFFLFSLASLCAQATSDWNDQLEQALQLQQTIIPQEKIYLHTDRTLYLPGDNVWLVAYLTASDNGYKSAKSQLVHVDLVSPGGNTIQTRTISQQQDAFKGDFNLPPTLPGGTYKLRAYTNYQGNFQDKYLFEKDIQVQRSVAPKLLLKLETEREAYGPGDTVTAFFSGRDLQNNDLKKVSLSCELRAGTYKNNFTATTNELGTASLSVVLPDDLATTDVQLSVRLTQAGQSEQISRPVPVVLDNISMKFLPEGGDWVAGFACRMAFVAKNEFDEPVDVEGTVYDANNQVVTSFQSLHDGLGSIVLPADVKAPLRARLHKPIAGKRVYPLPDPIMGNWQLAVDYTDGDVLVLKAAAQRAEELQLAIRTAGQLQDCQVWQLTNGQQELGIDVSGLPMGMAQITVFDQQLRPVWERLVFLHPNQQLRVEMTTDKKQYEFRDQVKLDLQVTDEQGKGVSGQFSLAVIDDQLHSFADDKQANILAQLLLTSELHGKIHEPNFYFDPTEEDRLAALDLLLLTHGWRRFHWRQLLQQRAEDWQAMVKYPVEVLSLSAYARLDGQYLRNAKIRVSNEETLVLATDNYGRFFVENPPLGDDNKPFTIRYQGAQTEVELDQVMAVPVATLFKPDGVVSTDQEKTMVFLEIDPMEEVLEEEPVMAGVRENAEFFDDFEKEETLTLDEVVVTGLGISRKDMNSGSIQIRSMNRPANANSDFDLAIEMDMDDFGPVLEIVNANQSNYINYARVFAFPDYSQQAHRQSTEVDKRQTIYWSPDIRTDQNGKASVSFFTTDDMTTFRATLEGIGNNDRLAHSETTFSAAPPLAVQFKMPAFALTGDVLQVPIVITNNTNRKISSPLTAELLGDGLAWLEELPTELTIAANSFEQLTAKVRVSGRKGQSGIRLSAGAQRWAVQQEEQLQIHQVGFPHEASTSGQQQRANYDITINDPIDNTMNASLRLFPDLTGQLLSGLEAMLGQPGGCFEQTSSTNYPNIMVLQYLKERQELDAETRERSFNYLQTGYDRLAGYEVPTGGFSLWGQAPAEPVLSAFGLLQFNDLMKVWPKVDPELVPRTYNWLIEAYSREQSRSEVDRAYMLYALAEVGDYQDEQALAALNHQAEASQTPYLLAIAARLNKRYGHPARAASQVAQLLQRFEQDQFQDAMISPYFSHGIGSGLRTELTAWTILAALEAGVNKVELTPLMDFLMMQRQGVGRFGATQPTVMALQAITAYEKADQRPKSSGQLVVSINQETIDTLAYSPESNGVLALHNLGKHLKAGNNHISVRFVGTQHPLPYSLQVEWQSLLPPEQTTSPLKLRTALSRNEVQRNDNIRYSVELSNQRQEAGYAPMLILSTPAGLQWQTWQLKEMKDRGEIDYYEMQDPYLVIYFAEIGAQATKKLQFDLTALIPGTYQAPAASAYLYYEDAARTWIPGEKIVIRD